MRGPCLTGRALRGIGSQSAIRAHVIAESGDADQQAFPPWQLDRRTAFRARVLALLVYAGIAPPAVWSASPARRKAACRCRKSCRLAPPGNIHGSGRRAGPGAEPGRLHPQRVDADARQEALAAAPAAGDARCSDRCTRPGPVAGGVRGGNCGCGGRGGSHAGIVAAGSSRQECFPKLPRLLRPGTCPCSVRVHLNGLLRVP